MRILVTIGRIASLGLAVALCAPAVLLIRQEIICPRTARSTSFADLVSGSYSHHANPSEMLVSVGPLTLSGWQLWVAAGILVLAGLLFAWLGVHAILSRWTRS